MKLTWTPMPTRKKLCWKTSRSWRSDLRLHLALHRARLSRRSCGCSTLASCLLQRIRLAILRSWMGFTASCRSSPALQARSTCTGKQQSPSYVLIHFILLFFTPQNAHTQSLTFSFSLSLSCISQTENFQRRNGEGFEHL